MGPGRCDLPGGDRTKQWFVRSTFDLSYTAYGNGAKEALAFIRANGSDFRLLAHHYSSFSGNLPANPFRYWSMPKGSLSPDGKLVVFDSNMLAAAPGPLRPLRRRGPHAVMRARRPTKTATSTASWLPAKGLPVTTLPLSVIN